MSEFTIKQIFNDHWDNFVIRDGNYEPFDEEDLPF